MNKDIEAADMNQFSQSYTAKLVTEKGTWTSISQFPKADNSELFENLQRAYLYPKSKSPIIDILSTAARSPCV